MVNLFAKTNCIQRPNPVQKGRGGGGGVGRIDVNPTCKTRLCDVVIFWLKRKKYSLVLKNAELHVVHFFEKNPSRDLS